MNHCIMTQFMLGNIRSHTVAGAHILQPNQKNRMTHHRMCARRLANEQGISKNTRLVTAMTAPGYYVHIFEEEGS